MFSEDSSADLGGTVSSSTPETIERVKREAAAVLNDSFFARLDDVKQVQERLSYGDITGQPIGLDTKSPSLQSNLPNGSTSGLTKNWTN